MFAALRAEPSLAACALYDAVPVEAAAPYVTLGPDVVTDWSAKTDIGHEHRVQLTVWDNGPGSSAAKRLLPGVESAVRSLAGRVDGHRIANVCFLRAYTTKAADGWTQGIAEFRIRTQQL